MPDPKNISPEVICPDKCHKFECVSSPDVCNDECSNVPLCRLCRSVAVCTDLDKRKYIKNDNKHKSIVIEPITVSADEVNEMLNRHRFLEMRLEELRLENRSYNILTYLVSFKRVSYVKRMGAETKYELRFLRKLFKQFDIKYELNTPLEPIEK